MANRIRQLCKERRSAPNAIRNISAVPQATVKRILNGKSKNAGTVTIKKLCDGLEITLGEFFSTPEFDALEQEKRKCPLKPTDGRFEGAILYAVRMTG